MKNVILTPNPYRDRNFQTMRNAMQILRNAGIQPKLCLPFEVDRNYELPKDLRFSRLDRELPNAELVICFGGDGTILHMAKAATRRGVPLLGVNIGTMGFMAELESTAKIMVSNVTYETAEELSKQIEDVEGVSMVTFDDTPDHYTNASALFDISFDGVFSDEISKQALSDVEALMDGYDYCVYS